MRKQDNPIYRELGIAPLFLVLVLAGLFAVGFGAWYVGQKVKVPEPVFCTQDAKQCPDGSYVGRTGPKCEFAPCPSEALCEGGPCPNMPTSTDTINRIGVSSPIDISDWKTYRNDKYGFEFRYPPSFSVREFGTNMPDAVIRGEYLPSGTQFPTIGSVDVGVGEKDIFEIDIYGNKQGFVEDFKWSDFENYPSPVKNAYDWNRRPCGQQGFYNLASENKTTFNNFEALQVVSDFYGIKTYFYCINYPQNPFIIWFEEYAKKEVDQILSTFKFVESTKLEPCKASNLKAAVGYEGATGSMAGWVTFTNKISTACSLEGYPGVQLQDKKGNLLKIEYGGRFSEDYEKPQRVVLQPNEQSQAEFSWTNWCQPAPEAPFSVIITLPQAEKFNVLIPDSRLTPRCDAPDSSSTISVGPFIKR